jgi:hypothetical protein
MTNEIRCLLTALLLAAPLPAEDKAEDKAKGMSVSLRAVPRVAAAPVSVLFTAELQGGANSDVYCPTLEWTWGDGSKGSNGGECPPYVAGESEVPRLFEAEHEYRQKGQPAVTLRVTKEGKTLGVARVDLRIGAPYKRSIELEQR